MPFGKVAILYDDEAIASIRQIDVRNISTPFNNSAWILNGWKLLPKLGTPAALSIESNDEQHIFPMSSIGQRRRTLTLPISPLGDYYDFSPPLKTDDTESRALSHRFRRVLADDCSIDFRNLPEHSSATRIFTLALGGELSYTAAPILTIDDCPEWSTEKRIRTLVKRVLGRGGALKVDTDISSAKALEFLNSRRKNWRERGKYETLPPPERTSQYVSFFSAAVAGLSQSGCARIFSLQTSQGEPMAEDLHFGPLDRPLLYMRWFDNKFAKLSPGTALLHLSVEFLRNNGVKELDLGCGAEAYKMNLNPRKRSVVAFRAR